MHKQFCVLATVLSVMSASAFADSRETLFSLNGKQYQVKDISPKLQQAYYSIELKAKEAKEQVLTQAMLDAHFAQVAKKSKKTIESVRSELLKIAAVTDDDVQAFYEQYKDRIGAPLEEIAPRIRETLEEQKRQQKAQELITELKSKGQFVNLLPAPEAPVFKMDLSAYPYKGKAGAAVKVVEFADYRCHYCKKAKEAVDNVLKDYGDKVQFYYIDLPVLDRGTAGVSTQVAQGAYCAGKQGKYWAFHDMGYDDPSSLNNESPALFAKKLGLDMKKFNQCLGSKEAENYIKKAAELADKLGVSGTPMFFVNGQMQSFRNIEQDLKQEIDRRLSTKGSGR